MANTTDKKVPFLTVVTLGGGEAGATTGLNFKLGNGQSLTLKFSDMSQALQRRAMEHGFNQKVRDSAAGAKGDYATAYDAMKKVIETLESGEWDRARTGGGVQINLDDLAFAIAKIKNADIEKAKMAVEKADEEKRKLWSKNARVAQLMAEAKALRLAKAAESAEELEIDLGEDEVESEEETNDDQAGE